MGRLDLGLAGAYMRFRLHGGLGMSRRIQRRSANNKGLTKSEDTTARQLEHTTNEPIRIGLRIVANWFNPLSYEIR